MGSFYTATLYPAENNKEVKALLTSRNFYLCSKNDDYNLVTEEKMDEQKQADILHFVKKLSQNVAKPIISYMIHDSDVLYFTIYQNGKALCIIDNTEEYFNGGAFVHREYENIALLFGINEANWKKEVCEAQFKKCVFADEFLCSLLQLLKMPEWVYAIGYTYLEEDEYFKAELQESGITVEKYEKT